MKKDRWLILIIIIFVSSILLFVLNDREKEPEKTKDNQLKCSEDYVLIPERNICYNENPLGHTVMTFPQVLASILTIGLITMYEFKDWRIYLSSKILPYKNKYVDELQLIPKSPDIYEKHGFLWVRGGYDALVSGRDNNIYVSRKENTARIGHNLILKGSIEKITVQQLYKYIGYDFNLLKEILENPILKVNSKGKLENLDQILSIYLTFPLEYQESRAYNSIKGGFEFGADRFNLIVEALFKMNKGLSGFGNKLQQANENMLTNAKSMSESTANISTAVRKTQDSNIDTGHRLPVQNQQNIEPERHNM
ncbi:MAG: hypothetical protein PHP06_05980 [Clostridia bacterium]|nr:hypothetical protein [Clostridia bacterium]